VVALVVRLKLVLLRNTLKRSPWQVVGLAFASLYGLGAVVLVVAGMVAVSMGDAAVRAQLTGIIGAALVLGWWVVPVLAFGLDGTLDPSQFVTFPVPRRSLLSGLAVATLVGVPGVLTVVCALSTGAAWWKDPGALAVGLVGAVVGLALAVVGGRAIVAVAGRVASGRRVREIMAAGTAFVAIGFWLAVSRIAERAHTEVDAHTFDGLAHFVGWTPFGAPWAAPAAAARGDWAGALLRLVIAVVTLAAAAWAWDRAVELTLVEPARNAVGRSRQGLGWFDRFPATQLGAVSARCATVWFRDPRYVMSIVFVPLTVLVPWFLDRGGPATMFSGPIAALLLGWSISAEVSYDGRAFWTQLSAPLAGRTDRLGRVIGASVVTVPLLLVIATAGVIVARQPGDLVVVLAASLGVLLTGFGVASIASAIAVFPVQQPGENPFQSRQGASLAVIVSQFAGWSAVALVSAPGLVLAWFAHKTDSPLLALATVVVGLGVGTAVLVVGVRTGGRLLERRGPELFEKVMSFP
jgi:ABC-2 type transport system permease protein